MQEISYWDCILKCFLHLIAEAWGYFLVSRGSILHLSLCSGKAWDVCTIIGTLQFLTNSTWVGVSFPVRLWLSTTVNAGLSLLIRSKPPWQHKAKFWPDQIWIKWAINPFCNGNCKLALVVPTLTLCWLPDTSAPTAPSPAQAGSGSSSFPPFPSDACWAPTPHLQLFPSEPRPVPSHNYCSWHWNPLPETLAIFSSTVGFILILIYFSFKSLFHWEKKCRFCTINENQIPCHYAQPLISRSRNTGMLL